MHRAGVGDHEVAPVVSSGPASLWIAVAATMPTVKPGIARRGSQPRAGDAERDVEREDARAVRLHDREGQRAGADDAEQPPARRRVLRARVRKTIP